MSAHVELRCWLCGRTRRGGEPHFTRRPSADSLVTGAAYECADCTADLERRVAEVRAGNVIPHAQVMRALGAE